MRVNGKMLLVVSLIGVVLWVIDIFILQARLCTNQDWCGGALRDLLVLATGYLTVFVPCLLVSGFSTLFKMEIPKSWIILSLFWIPISIFASYIFGQGHGGWITSSPEPQGVFFLMMIPYLLVSVVIILHSSWRNQQL